MKVQNVQAVQKVQIVQAPFFGVLMGARTFLSASNGAVGKPARRRGIGGARGVD
jgi:hypothetical protein